MRAVATCACGDDAAMVSESVAHGGGQPCIAEDAGPFTEVQVGGDDQAARFSSRMNRSIEGEAGQIPMQPEAGRGERWRSERMTRSHVQPALLRSRRPDVPTLLHCDLAKSSRDRDAGQARQPCDLAGRLVPAKPHPSDLSCHRRRAHRFVDLLVKKSAGNAEWPGQFLPVQFLNRHQPRKRISFGAAAMRRVVGACHALFHMARRPSAGLSQGAQRRMGPQAAFPAGCARAMRASSRPCALIAPLGLRGKASLSAARVMPCASQPRLCATEPCPGATGCAMRCMQKCTTRSDGWCCSSCRRALRGRAD